jgi:hypothetical protein
VAGPACDWGVAYFCPYDNDLERAGPIILHRIRSGLASPRQAVALQADYTDAGGMRRFAITAQGITETRVASDDSADEDQAVAFLEWFVKTCPCRHYAFVFLNHGGTLDQLSRDDHPPAPKAAPAWMSGRVLGEKLRRFKEQLRGRWELLFFQQCGRGSLENLYSFRGTADFVLCSPMNVGAPNTYYTALHKWLDAHPEGTGGQLAELIAAEDADYRMYSCVRGARLEELPKRLGQVLAPFTKPVALSAPVPPPAVYTEADESTRDALAYFERLSTVNKTGAGEVAEFRKWVQEEFLSGVWYEKKAAEQTKRLCAGVSLFVPDDPDEARRYKDLDLYKKSALPELWTKLHPAR